MALEDLQSAATEAIAKREAQKSSLESAAQHAKEKIANAPTIFLITAPGEVADYKKRVDTTEFIDIPESAQPGDIIEISNKDVHAHVRFAEEPANLSFFSKDAIKDSPNRIFVENIPADQVATAKMKAEADHHKVYGSATKASQLDQERADRYGPNAFQPGKLS